uniref:Phosphoserine phosphatase n=1 Tax=Caenorhabditis tropicalis TaxID=1561998 RepID=A0A1I7TE35_9PELO
MIRVALPTSASAIPRSISTSASESISKNQEEETKRVWRKADAVCFDVDSTVCQDEGIDELAAYLGVGEAVANVTRTAMNGNARFRDALAARLQVMKPNHEQLEQFVNITKPKLTVGIKELVGRLHARGTHVYLVSGGFRRLILPVAELLGIEKSRVYANEILFDKQGNYHGFDTSELTSDSGSKETGKPAVIALLKKKCQYKTVVMVGDGATDAEAAPPADAFIGFGGNVIREGVKARAKWYVTDFDVLRKDLEHDDFDDE